MKIQILASSYQRSASFVRSTWSILVWYCRRVALRLNPFWVRFYYFITICFLGFGLLKAMELRTKSITPTNVDFLYSSVAAATNSGLNAIQLEEFSNSQLGVMAFLMLVSGEIFVSTIGILFKKQNIRRSSELDNQVGPGSNPGKQVELSSVNGDDSDEVNISMEPSDISKVILQRRSVNFLGLVLISYLVGFHLLGVVLVLGYLNVISSTKQHLQSRGLKLGTFAIFTTIASFSNSGLIPTNENMMAFCKNSGMLLVIIVLCLVGNSLFAPLLRLILWCLGKFIKKEESEYLLSSSEEIGYRHLFPLVQTSLVTMRVLGILALQFVLFMAMEWSSDSLAGMNSYQKLVSSLFMSVNSRHTDENVQVLFIVAMYLPSYTCFQPVKGDLPERIEKRRGIKMENFLFSEKTCVIIFIVIICITERKKMKSDPLNFNVMNVIFEVVSAYGNVGFSVGYSCERLVGSDSNCQNKYISFSGKWSDEGKMVLVIVMLFGRLKNFHMGGGKSMEADEEDHELTNNTWHN